MEFGGVNGLTDNYEIPVDATQILNELNVNLVDLYS
jgi:hypothetical protein